jgi:hypothetical protein
MPKSNVTPYTTPVRHRKMNTKPHQNLLTLASASCLALLLLLTASACGSDGPDDAEDPQPSRDRTTSAEPTTTTLATQDEVEQAYESFVAMLQRVTTTTVDPNDPELPLRLTDPALGGLRTQLSTWQAEGQVWLIGDQTRHNIESVVVQPDGVSAIVRDCVVSNDALVPVGTTTAMSFPSPSTDRGITTMVQQDGRWLVKDTDFAEHWDGVAGCAS